METKSFTCWTDPLHFQLPPTKNLRDSKAEEELKARLAAVVAALLAEVATLAAALEKSMVLVGLIMNCNLC
jgi:hypothetical protein